MIGYSPPGTSVDWVYDTMGAHALCFEIHTRGSGIGGFYPDPSLIMAINNDVDDSLIYQCRVADTDLGDGTTLLYPPAPYILYGTVTCSQGFVMGGTDVILENFDTGETLSISTDMNGYYEFNYGNLVEHGYSHTDTFVVSAWNTSVEFDIGDEWGQRIDMEIELRGEPPHISIISPNGGEEWYGKTQVDITWSTIQGGDPTSVSNCIVELYRA